MPLFDFSCSSCGTKFEAYQHPSADNVGKWEDCPECGFMAKRLWPRSGIAFHPFKEEYNVGLGKHISSRSQLREEIRKLNAAREAEFGTPSDIVCSG